MSKVNTKTKADRETNHESLCIPENINKSLEIVLNILKTGNTILWSTLFDEMGVRKILGNRT